jgi:acyl-CoA thioester hydrolase
MAYKISFYTKWADFDANKHMRHTAYNDYAAECRIRFFKDHGFPPQEFEKHHFGPILFKEETTFLREVNLGDQISIELYLEGISAKGDRFKMLHKIFREDGVLAAEIKIYAAFIDLKTRKLTQPSPEIVKTFASLERTDDFEKIKLKRKTVD